MDFRNLILARISVRAYRTDPVPESLLQEVLEAARLAPSACNRQPFRVVVIHTKGRETPFGWPLDSPGPRERKPLEDLVHYERWQGPPGT
jgi:Nitroreductase family